jgi:hypothetical protein
MVRVTVLYPSESGKRFDHACHGGKHRPMVVSAVGRLCTSIAHDILFAGASVNSTRACALS